MKTRRAVIVGTGTLAAALLAGCQITSNGGAVTGTLDIDRIVTDGGAVVAALEAALTAPPVIVLLGADVAPAGAAFAAAQQALADIRALTGGQLTLSLDTGKVQALVTSLLADAQTVLRLLQAAAPKLSGATASTVQTYLSACQTLLPFISLAAALPSPVGAMRGGAGQTEAVALAAIRAQRTKGG